jgi:hypothetical protein
MKFNFSIRRTAPVVNHEGAKAYRLTPQAELYAAVATTLLSNTAYEKADARLARIQKLITGVDAEFVAKLAIYARTQLNLRTAPVVLATELARKSNGTSLVSKTIARIVQRPDEIMEVLGYYQMANERTGTKKLNRLSKQVQKGLALSFNRFDEYQFAKYNRDAVVMLRDALFLVHPKPKDEAQQALFNKIAAQELATPYTWETELSALGQQHFESNEAKAAAFRTTWEALIDSGKLGYMALLRNLRNILEAGVSAAHVEKLCAYLTREDAVAKSRQLPFRFLAAYRELKSVQTGYTSYVLDALETALRRSVVNLQGFDLNTRVVIACDVSGSMQKPVSAKSKVQLFDIGLLLGMLLQSKCKNVKTGMFGDSWKTIALPAKNILSNVDAFYRREGEVGYSTNGYKVVEDLVAKKYVADKVMLFTDTQLWDSKTGNQSAENTLAYQWARYKKIAPAAKLYLFDLAGYGNTPVKTEAGDVTLIAGWSDKIFEVLEAVESGEDALKQIQEIVL